MGGVRRTESVGRGNLESGRTVWIFLDRLLTNFEICSCFGLVNGIRYSQNRYAYMLYFKSSLPGSNFRSEPTISEGKMLKLGTLLLSLYPLMFFKINPY